ncbi:hypothetical protein PMZ80_004019 [Knufia obscura]|uniref:Uncharacterized protein n=2 Tax=Knufia TaxID=430999 RepID=A0AAN8ECG0_9EURO|nr:hypothetical protein PMZ80_004019 [Knufia obscura]KAK5952254.1 hypothetical protein OHC33_006727 [Knufia fluminis]
MDEIPSNGIPLEQQARTPGILKRFTAKAMSSTRWVLPARVVDFVTTYFPIPLQSPRILISRIRLFWPPIKPGMVRLEWECDCGELLYGDFIDPSPATLPPHLWTATRKFQGLDTSSEAVQNQPTARRSPSPSVSASPGMDQPEGDRDSSGDQPSKSETSV